MPPLYPFSSIEAFVIRPFMVGMIGGSIAANIWAAKKLERANLSFVKVFIRTLALLTIHIHNAYFSQIQIQTEYKYKSIHPNAGSSGPNVHNAFIFTAISLTSHHF